MKREDEGYWLTKGQYLKGKYRIEDVIEEGGMGIVYLGYDDVLQTRVSIKEYFPRRFAMRAYGETDITIYKGHLGELFRQGLDKFVNEARIMAKFEMIDSVVMVKDFFFENQTAYMVMEHVEGENVKQYVERNGKMKPGQVLTIMRPILCAVGELHREGLLHRDIAPDNIIMTEEGRGCLIDFGSARFTELPGNKTMTVFFKRGYSPKEQYLEKSERGAYTDVYSASATMYFMLTGIRPEESVHRLLHDTVVPLTHFRNIEMENIKKRCIMKGMSVKAKDRYTTMEKMCEVLYGDSSKFSRFVHKMRHVISAFFFTQ